MNETIRMVSVLVIICILSAIALSLTYESTINIINERRSEELQSALNEVYPSETFEEADVPEGLLEKNVKQMFKAKDGLVLLIEQPGFQSNIKILVGIDTIKKQITDIKILEHLETPGLGSRIEEPGFLSQFKNKELEQQKFDAITGATISSSAIINAVKAVSMQILGPDAATTAKTPLKPADSNKTLGTYEEAEKARKEVIESLIEKQKSNNKK